MMTCIRVVDGGGEGFRRADFVGSEDLTSFTTIGSVGNIDELLDFACGDLPPSAMGISYAVAGDVEDHNKMTKSPNIHLLDGVPLADLTQERLKIPCVVCNDMEATVMGMAGLLPDLDYFMGITWSSGIGLRIFQEGRIVAESEGGHVPLDPSPYAPRCGCGVCGCAESILGGQSIRRRVINETETLGVKIPSNVDPCAFLDKEYQRDEDWAIDTYDLISTGMATFLVNYITIFRLPVIVWKGTFGKYALSLIEGDIRSKMRDKLINPDWANVRFEFSPMPDKDGLIGAAKVFQSLIKE